jgi:hypothetical protein
MAENDRQNECKMEWKAEWVPRIRASSIEELVPLHKGNLS